MEVKLLLVGGNVEWGNSFPTSEEEIDIPNFYINYFFIKCFRC